MSRGSYGYVGRRSSGAAWQYILIGIVMGFGCSVVLVLGGLATGFLTLQATSVANLPSATPFVITATPAPVTPTVAAAIPSQSPAGVATATVGFQFEAPTASPTIDATFLTLQPTSLPTTAANGAQTTQSVNSTQSNNGNSFASLSSLASDTQPVDGGAFTMGTNSAEVNAAVQECKNGYGGDPGTCDASMGEDSAPEHSVT